MTYALPTATQMLADQLTNQIKVELRQRVLDQVAQDLEPILTKLAHELQVLVTDGVVTHFGQELQIRVAFKGKELKL